MAEVSDAEIVGRDAVRRFDEFCDRHGWVFAAVPGERDHGKDGYVDVGEAFDEGGVRRLLLKGEMFAVQVKGGRVQPVLVVVTSEH